MPLVVLQSHDRVALSREQLAHEDIKLLPREVSAKTLKHQQRTGVVSRTQGPRPCCLRVLATSRTCNPSSPMQWSSLTVERWKYAPSLSRHEADSNMSSLCPESDILSETLEQLFVKPCKVGDERPNGAMRSRRKIKKNWAVIVAIMNEKARARPPRKAEKR